MLTTSSVTHDSQTRASTDEVKRIYESVWDEYSTWSRQYNHSALQGLSRPRSRRNRPVLKNKQAKKARPAKATSSSTPPSSTVHSCTIIDFDDEGEPIENTTISLEPVVLDTAKFPPYPPYHSCNPVSQNILVGDDSHYMPFIPFSDDPTYNHSVDLELYHYTAWQKPGMDPDEQHILLETVRRLVYENGLSYKDIDSTCALPMQCCDIVRLLRERDFPQWPPNAVYPPLPTASDSPLAAVDYFLEYFCSNLNCLTGFCTLHDGESVRQQAPKSVPPKVPYIKASDTVEAPCGINCFLQPPTTANFETPWSAWSKEDREVVDLTLRYAPDTTPCDLAVICRKPCREIHRYQSAHHRTVSVAPKSRNPAQFKTKQYDDEIPNQFTPAMPCRHPGPCNASSDCECYNNKGHCHTRCGCNKTYDGKAVLVQDQKKYAEQGNVPAIGLTSSVILSFAIRVELDEHNGLCRNVGIQKGAFKATEVRESKWGLGLFLVEPANEKDLISEYIGEMIRPLTVDSRNFHADHRDRSYVFHLNPTYALDSAYVGNATRYMNHNYESPNCHTKVVMVNGEHRIGVYAARRIEQGEELFINYGTNFWKSDRQAQFEKLAQAVAPAYDDSKDSTYEDMDDLDSSS